MGILQSSPQLPLAERRYRISPPNREKSNKLLSKRNANGLMFCTKESGIMRKSTNVFISPSVSFDSNISQQSSSSSQQIDQLAGGVSSLSIIRQFDTELVPRRSRHPLTKRQRILIENSWRRAQKSGAEHVGSKMFLKVLLAEPESKAIFGLQKIPQGRLKYDPRFRQHAVVFLKSFEYIIKNLSYTEKLEQHFQALGRRHARMQGRGFLPKYWDTFAECMTQSAVEWEGGQRGRETVNAWRILVSFVIKQMQSGFDYEKTSRRTCISTPVQSSYCSIGCSAHITDPLQYYLTYCIPYHEQNCSPINNTKYKLARKLCLSCGFECNS